MNRAERKRQQRELDKKQVIYHYTEQQLYEEAYKIADRLLETVGGQVRQCFKDAMRENRISELRAEKIADRANELMKIKAGL